LWTLPLTTPYSVIEASFIPSLHGRAAHTGGKRRFALKTIYERLAIAATGTPPMPYRLLKLAEARW
jgi:hypothetical protein